MVNIDKNVSCLLKKFIYPSNFFFNILNYVLLIFFPFLMDIASIVVWYLVSIVSQKKKKVSHINLRKMILKFHYAITK